MRKRKILLFALCLTLGCSLTACKRDRSEFEREDYMKNHVTLMGCPKLDDVDYSEKLTEILKNNDIKSLKIVRMEVPCCGGMEHAAVTALKNSGKMIPWQVVTLTCDGRVKED